ncbi:hypothetical protein [Lentilactobacillus sp. Marseille-Q4993]|uniref:hypothetical protein n=1 Tax=Lentilactobacillus sp. Marseille-Q4993 TaxID=3039492 RepID=UPI0024BCDBAB|nr:hypothetical protein [Lentilactobacillus sp. Marseille-Q4993]
MKKIIRSIVFIDDTGKEKQFDGLSSDTQSVLRLDPARTNEIHSQNVRLTAEENEQLKLFFEDETREARFQEIFDNDEYSQFYCQTDDGEVFRFPMESVLYSIKKVPVSGIVLSLRF